MNVPEANAAAVPEIFRLSRADIEAIQSARLAAMLAEVAAANPFWRAKFAEAGVDAAQIKSPADLARLPFTTKAELLEDQERSAPYGTNLTYPLARYSRLHQTSGSRGRPMRWLDTPESWDWLLRLWGAIFDAARVGAEDRLFFPFSFGPFLGFWAGFEAAARRGCLTLAGGAMTTEARLQFLIEHKATVLACTPTYALHLAEVAREKGLDLAGSPVRALVVAGEPGGSLPATKRAIEAAWGARCLDHWGMTEIGSLGFEDIDAPGGTYLLETDCIAEIIDPATDRAVAPGERGELVITNLGRWGTPLIRYRTGDLAAAETEPTPGGTSLLRLRGGILGRLDDMVFIRGNNLYPAALEALLREMPEIAEYRAEVASEAGLARLRLTVETREPLGSNSASLRARIGNSVKQAFNFSPEVELAAPGSLPRFEMKAQRFVIHPSYRKETP